MGFIAVSDNCARRKRPHYGELLHVEMERSALQEFAASDTNRALAWHLAATADRMP